ncbi:hypothetical protein GOV12_04770 [Candidatus Pacearchaeota archaeon]|nr:hypothetical protein [Candidatus Pacearchaeota archaeon]
MTELTRNFYVEKIGSPTRPADFSQSLSNRIKYEPADLIKEAIREIFDEPSYE